MVVAKRRNAGLDAYRPMPVGGRDRLNGPISRGGRLGRAHPAYASRAIGLIWST